ncbi:MAG: HAD family phosphatase [Clostridia bacterium]|nr:HAD family phosphatase [Clostridia bacterium]
MKKACIFDFDGVIVDSERYHHLGWQAVAKEIGTDLTYEEYAPFKSAGRTVIIPYLFKKAGKVLKQEDIEKYVKVREQKIAVEIVKLNEADVIDGVVDFIKLLKANGIKTAVASASASSTGVAKRFGLYKYFDAFVDGNDNMPRKPDPTIYYEAARRMGVDYNDCIVFEDSILGVQGAKNAGMYCVGYQTHFTDIADTIIDSFVGLDLSVLDI